LNITYFLFQWPKSAFKGQTAESSLLSGK